MTWKDSTYQSWQRKKRTQQKEVLYLFDTRSNIASHNSLHAVTAANDTQATATQTHIPYSIYQYKTNWVLEGAL
jgi:hypothetical protein